jgi:eukaryotic translation initiation factor 2C
VLRDDNKLTADEMQKLSYYLCFTYARCIKPISIPTPVMYAHLAAYRSKLHIVAQNIETEGSERGETGEQREERESIIAAILNDRVRVSDELRARLYYC